MKRLFILLPLLLCGVISTIFAQTVVTMGGSTTSVTGCNFVIYDHGGQNGDYGPYRNDILTIHSNDPTMSNVQLSLQVNNTDISFTDTLYIYDGDSDVDSLLIAAVNSSTLAGIGNEIIFTATVMNPTGALTLKFVSDSIENGSGFVINSTCVQACQRVGIEIDSVLSSHYPHLDEDGFYYIDLCGHDTLHLVLHGAYPDNDYNYHQDDAQTTFKWDLGIEYIEGVGMNILDYFFEHGRGYDVSISNVDSAGCENMNPTIFRIRTSDNPIKHVHPLPPMCTGDEITITASYSNLSVLQYDSIYSEQLTTLAVYDTVFIPDGKMCNGICAFESPVTFTAFAPSATIQSADDIWYVRAKLEHTFIGDIYVALTCPPDPVTGVRRSAKILKKYGNSSTTDCTGYIPSNGYGWNVTTGIGSGTDFGAALHNDGSYCDPNDNPMGTPWNYCWSNNTTNGYQYANGQGYVYETVNQNHHLNGSVDSSNMVTMTNIYHPDESFASLIGCPMNGTWSITVVDSWYGDNGYITEWEMALDPSLVPQDWSYTVFVDTVYLTGPGADGTSVIPTESGTIPYVAHVIDDLGCMYDTTLTLEIIERPHPDLGPDISICHGQLYQLNCGYDQPYTSLVWNTGEHTPDIYLSSSGEYSVRVTVANEDGLECTGSDTVNIVTMPKPIPDFYASDTAGCAPLSIHMNNTTVATGAATMTYQWVCYDENGIAVFSSDKESPDFTLDREGAYTIFLRATTSDGCQDSLTKYDYIRVNYQPAAEFDAIPEVALWSETNGSILFQVQGDTLAFGQSMGFSWDFGDDTPLDSSSYTIEHSYSSWGDYDVTLSMFTPEGCNSSITHTISLEADLVFPNVITPNGDGVNDVFAIGNLNTSMNSLDPDKYRSNELTIYDRWGKQVYHAENYDTFMDMTGERGEGIIIGEKVFDAAKVTDGSYFYTFYYKGKFKTVNYHGTLQIIRDRK